MLNELEEKRARSCRQYCEGIALQHLANEIQVDIGAKTGFCQAERADR